MAERPDLRRRAAAEGIGAFALVFAGCGAIVTDAVHAGVLGAVGVSFFALIMAMVYAPAISPAPTSTRGNPAFPSPALPGTRGDAYSPPRSSGRSSLPPAARGLAE